MPLKLALDRSVLRAFLRPVGGGQAWESTVDLQQAGAVLHVLPSVAEEMKADGDEWRQLWRDAGLTEVPADDFLLGCATGLAQRYLDYHPDPRNCRVAAEAECANLDIVLTLDPDFINGLEGRVEKIRIATPWDAAQGHRQTDVTRGTS
jgi:hypothetical protein